MHTLLNTDKALPGTDLDKLFKSIAYNTEMTKAKTRAIINIVVNSPFFLNLYQLI